MPGREPWERGLRRGAVEVGEEREDESAVRGGGGAAEQRRGDGGGGHWVGLVRPATWRRGGGRRERERRRASGGPGGPWWAVASLDQFTNIQLLADLNAKGTRSLHPQPRNSDHLQLMRHTRTHSPSGNPGLHRMRCLTCAASTTAPAARGAVRSVSRRRVVVEGAASATHCGEEAPPRFGYLFPHTRS